jgi:uncharacterized protein (TIGR01370 family)
MSQGAGHHVSRRVLLGGCVAATARGYVQNRMDRWLVYYSNKEPVTTFRHYSQLIFDNRYHPPLEPLLKAGRHIAGYLSVGEASPDYTYFAALQAEGLLVRPSPTWQGNYYIDIRQPQWKTRLFNEIIPGIVAAGFDGLFLDTLDSPLHLEETEPAVYKGMAAATVDLIHAMRAAYPHIKIIMNRAYRLLSPVSASIDVVVGESVFTTYDFAQKKYKLVDAAGYRRQVQLLQGAVRRRPDLRVFTLDYWEPSDAEGIARIYQEERANGFSPYVSSIDLTRVVPEPQG